MLRTSTIYARRLLCASASTVVELRSAVRGFQVDDHVGDSRAVTQSGPPFLAGTSANLVVDVGYALPRAPSAEGSHLAAAPVPGRASLEAASAV
jgi:hypothetical protein